MNLLEIIILGFLAKQLIICITNSIFQEELIESASNNDLVSVIIPARDEEENIGKILNDIELQDYDNIEIIVFNDDSKDKTQQVVETIANSNSRIKLINSTELKKNWLGKNHACYSASKVANGKYFLFIDADVRITRSLISRSIRHMERFDLQLFSIFPKQVFNSWGEKSVVPLMNHILLSLLPLILVRISNFTSLSASNGQFMLFNAEIYKKIEPHKQVKNNSAEDIKIANLYKKNKFKISCTYNSQISCKMYNSYRDAINGFSKNIVQIFKNSIIFALYFSFVNLFAYCLYSFINTDILLICIGIIITKTVILSITLKENILENLLLHCIHHINLILLIFKSFGKKTWKGRSI